MWIWDSRPSPTWGVGKSYKKAMSVQMSPGGPDILVRGPVGGRGGRAWSKAG